MGTVIIKLVNDTINIKGNRDDFSNIIKQVKAKNDFVLGDSIYVKVDAIQYIQFKEDEVSE